MSLLQIVITSLATAIVTQAHAAELRDNPEKIVEAAHLGCLNNIAGFDYVDCSFVLKTGVIRDEASALIGKFEKSITTKARWVKRKGIERYYIETDEESKARIAKGPVPDPRRKGMGIVSVTFSGADRLDNGKYELRFTPDMDQAALLPADYPEERGGKEHPISVAVFDAPAFDWAARLLRTGQLKLENANVVGSGETQSIDARFVGTNTYHFNIDSSLGLLPTRLNVFKDGRLFSATIILDTIRFSNNRFFPSKVAIISWPTAKNPFFHVRTLEVTDLEVDHAPSDDALRVRLPAGTRVYQATDHKKRFRLKQDEIVGPDELASLWQMAERSVAEPLADTAIVRKSNWLYYVASALAAVIVAAYVMHRRKLSNAKASRIHPS